jgi:murein DD-endopeptidase MepM/ murein hydrolase activator NlpD
MAGMRRFRYLAVLALVVAATIPLTSRALAQQSDKQQQLEQQVADSSALEQSTRSQLAQVQAQRAKLDASLADVTTKLALANSRLAAAQADVDRVNFTGLVLQLRADATRRKLNVARDDVRHSAVLLYQHGDGAGMIGLLGSTNGSGELVEGQQYLQRVSEKRQNDARRVARLQADLTGQRQALAHQKESADAARATANDEKTKLAALATAQTQTRAAAAAAEQDEAVKHDAALAQHDQAEAALQAESDRIAQELQGSGGGPALGNGTFIWPVNAPITSPFGYRTDPVTGAIGFHAGLDLGAPCGTPIKAAGTGIVVSAGFNSGGYGNMTLISHGAGMSTLYGHQSSIIVAEGQSVAQGQVIGYVGSTGKSTGCHLHFEVRVNGNPVDPLGYL